MEQQANQPQPDNISSNDTANTEESSTLDSTKAESLESNRFNTSFLDSAKDKFANESARYITAALLIAGIGILLVWNNAIVIWAVLGAAFILGFRESLTLYKIDTNLWLYALALGAWILAFFSARPVEAALIACVILASVVAYKQNLSPKSILPFLYPTLPFLALYSVYVDFGVLRVVWLILIVALCDIGAYFGGRIFGKTPFSPTSPKKTLEGVIIGLAVAIVVGSIAGILMLNTHFLLAIVLSLFVAVCGVFGDLYESYLKRRAEVKDSGSILPGHGGILDRFDAVLFGAVGMHFFLMFFDEFACTRCSILGASLL
ncbi:phosphatidate cytidylyltransferase [Helicobacter canis]|uniref:Phosphatidate cytidylyltransferase n=1 Tax=Helicobacter canis NCTC 12740 TaxID=1357399 RepID=V8CFW4_9HELI|nr:phosphatidate cytidylyltransferase [Helicobacter canis]ETD25972.1 hypothetical protein HMPREF2087_01810 [Helicobacter canis NCTC 12740]